MIVYNNIESGMTDVYLGNKSIAQVYIGSHLVWPIEPPSTQMKLMFTTDEDEKASFDCSHTGKTLHTSTAYPSYALTDSEVLDLAYDNGMSGKTVTSITIGNCTEEIVSDAFSFRYDYSNKNYKSIENIKNFNMGNGVKKVGVFAFSGGYGDNKWYTNLTGFTLSNKLETIGKFAFFGLRSVRSFKLPDSLKTIGSSAFTQCSSAEFTFGDNIESIGSYAFKNCQRIRTIKIPNTTTSVGTSAFMNCSGATVLSIGSGLETINDSTFQNCSNLNRIDIPDNVQYIKNSVFSGCTSASAATIGSGCREIGSNLFNGCTNLQNVVFANGSATSTIGDNTFNGCKNLTSVTFSNTLDTIGAYTFHDCIKLTEVVYPDSVYSIGIQQFHNNYSVKSITIGSGCRIIGGNDGIFGCTSYTCKSVVPPTLNGNLSFGEGVDYKIYVPSESVEDYKTANGWSKHADHIFPITE